MDAREKPEFYTNHPSHEMRERPLLMRINHDSKLNEFSPIGGYSWTGFALSTLFILMTYIYVATIWFSSDGGLVTEHFLFFVGFAICSLYMLLHYRHCGETHIQERRIKTIHDWIEFIKIQKRNAIHAGACMLATFAVHIKLALDFSLITNWPVITVLVLEFACLMVVFWFFFVEIVVHREIATQKNEKCRLYIDESSLELPE